MERGRERMRVGHTWRKRHGGRGGEERKEGRGREGGRVILQNGIQIEHYHESFQRHTCSRRCAVEDRRLAKQMWRIMHYYSHQIHPQ